MVRPVRNKKPVNYSQFEDSDDDDDFVSATGPLNKKSRTTPKELKLERPKLKLKNLQKEDIPLQEKTPQKRMALDDKLYQRDLEVALALSVKEIPTVTIDLEDSQGNEKRGNGETERMDKSPHMSNCSVASDYLDLDKITEEGASHGAQGKRKAASKAVVQQRKILLEGSDGDSANNSEPDYDTVTSVDSAPPVIKSKSQPSPKKVSHSSEASRKPSQICSPSAEIKRPKWVPPAISGSSSTSSSPLAGVSVKSPNQSLRLGLSRLARVKPLHPNAVSS
ncbi:RAD51-associated protein 1 isoform X4 [Artibeus jamaicensis]|uniref:RAD51-associated protein 1 isoform X4 n=1 Tax=Artibeus jamaicensis TaxID=9417 RepID=UPI00235ACAB9|nr:RAD51-associated protein 1 isoform X4 [Artibeus jamaicensis]